MKHLEAPVQVFDKEDEYLSLGGAANLASNLTPFDIEVSIFGVLGKDESGKRMVKMLEEKRINTESLEFVSDRPTSVKTRLIAQHQQLLRVDDEERREIENDTENNILNNFQSTIEDLDGVILSDYGKGVFTGNLLDEIIELSHSYSVPVAVDPKGEDFKKYRGVSVLTPNRQESADAADQSCDTKEGIVKAAEQIRKTTQCDVLLV